ncbi:hypothetical protein ACFSO7_02965 [Bacillus sp. CGMCC 1.16607]|uniref:hypothetical protein n=1 Tax=Bacillus sp. CGMCC 1.16607 TaxID=3351842 RepID=UPI003639E04B
MAVIPKSFFNGYMLNTTTTHYTVPAGITAIVKNVVICNVTNTDQVVDLEVGSGGGHILQQATIKAKDTIVMDLSIVLNAGHTIKSKVNVGVQCSLIVSGVEVS